MTKTRQEIFDIAYRGLASQGFKRSKDGGACAYRDSNGRKCAIGWLIPDDKYTPYIENDTPSAGCQNGYMVRELAGISYEDASFATNLQRCHDDATNCVGVKSRLRDFAKRYKLTIPEVTP